MHGIALLLLFPVALAAQECPELPEVPKPQLRDCSFINIGCQQENQRTMKAWEDQTRRFGTPVSFASKDAKADGVVIQYQVGGCRGSLVNLELNIKRLSGLKYEILAPSGTTIAAEEMRPAGPRTVS
jgi:hypothetical protein